MREAGAVPSLRPVFMQAAIKQHAGPQSSGKDSGAKQGPAGQAEECVAPKAWGCPVCGGSDTAGQQPPKGFATHRARLARRGQRARERAEERRLADATRAWLSIMGVIEHCPERTTGRGGREPTTGGDRSERTTGRELASDAKRHELK